MRIHRLELKNFRNFEHTIFDFPERFTVLVGDNGTGKTAILDGLAVGVGALFLNFNNVDSRHIRDDEVRRVEYEKRQIPTVEPQYPVSVSCDGIIDGQEITWTRKLNKAGGRTTRKQATKITNISEQLQVKVSQGSDLLLPLVTYYGTGRLWLQKNKRSIQTVKPNSRMIGYLDCLDPASNQKLMLRWFKTMEIVALQRKQSIEVLDAVKEAIAKCIENWQSVTYDILEDELLAKSMDGRTLPFRMLSDGVRNMLAMVADIAYRAAVLNPQLGRDAAQQTPGVVLIDEIDLHLHPKWQRGVVDDLKKTFPNIQFVATTHSPFIIQSLREGELINLDKPAEIEEYENKSIEDITEYVMGVDIPQRSERYQKMMEAAEEYYRVLQEAQEANPEKIEQLKTKLDKLIEPFSDDVAYHAFLRMERKAAGLGGEKK
ncbi:AAA family ATPase [Coleofasciculus sp. G2-EDA-02]|uniref:AAA family ATPase n=1 Tax=Coleofasciculus sp. G2-EDA-02 TaxID=3069529 RepID=UPI0032F9ED74